MQKWPLSPFPANGTANGTASSRKNDDKFGLMKGGKVKCNDIKIPHALGSQPDYNSVDKAIIFNSNAFYCQANDSRRLRDVLLRCLRNVSYWFKVQ